MKLRISENIINLRLSPTEFIELKTKKTIEQKTTIDMNNLLKIKIQICSNNDFQLKNNHFEFNLTNSSYLKIENLIENRKEGSFSWIQKNLEIIIDVDFKK
ncbi:MAG: hypothetical protein U0T83_08750 [Bacteriovoracaceae bacterium]